MPKIQVKLINKTEITSKVYLLTFKTDSEVNYNSGQFLSLEIEPKINRPYSISYLGKTIPSFEHDLANYPILADGNYLSLMISTKPGGTASTFFDEIKTGTVLNAIGPSGRFALIDNPRPKIFVATGTGLAPFVAMIGDLINKNPELKIDLFFGCWNLEGNFVNNFFQDIKNKAKNLTIYTVAEDLQGKSESEFIKGGRVTTVIPEIISDFQGSDFYLCGHPAMVTSMEEVLKSNGAGDTNIVMEKFGSTPKV